MAEQNTDSVSTDVENAYSTPGGTDPKNMQEVTQYVSKTMRLWTNNNLYKYLRHETPLNYHSTNVFWQNVWLKKDPFTFTTFVLFSNSHIRLFPVPNYLRKGHPPRKTEATK